MIGKTIHMEHNNLYYGVSDIHFKKGSGIYLIDPNGREYIDCSSGTFNLALGYTNEEILASIVEQLNYGVHVSSSFSSDPLLQFVEMLGDIAPNNLNIIHPKVCGGSVANEGAIKIAQKYTGKNEVISWFRSHLGQTVATTNLSGTSFRKHSFPCNISASIKVPDPYCHRCFYQQKPDKCGFLCVERINDFIQYSSSGNISCIIVEPITGNGGNIVPPKGYFQQLSKLCDENDIVLIFDEIQTGIGRTGYFFAADYFEVTPDIITVAKGLGGIGFQVAAILTKEKFKGLEMYEHSFTFGANLIGMTAAAKTLEIISRAGFLENVRHIGAYIIERLYEIKKSNKIICDVRGVGLMIGVEISDSNGNPDVALTNKIVELARIKYKVLLRTSLYGFGNVIKIRPALIITKDEAESLCVKLGQIFSEFK